MDQDTVIAAAPTCSYVGCDEPIARVEMRWHYGDGGWWPGPWYKVCRAEHREKVRPIDDVIIDG